MSNKFKDIPHYQIESIQNKQCRLSLMIPGQIIGGMLRWVPCASSSFLFLFFFPSCLKILNLVESPTSSVYVVARQRFHAHHK